MQATLDLADLEHLIAQKHLLAVPRASSHSHFAVGLALNDERSLLGRRQALKNFFERVCSHKSHRHSALELLLLVTPPIEVRPG